ncbi:MAG: hypothetical protein K1X94_21395 [Sandaracinaceae bacterium]|nr:hypothetical protein [Sandaracinaceae bacterium]
MREAMSCARAPEGDEIIFVCGCGDLYAGSLNSLSLAPAILRRVGKDGTLHPFMVKPKFRRWIPDTTSEPVRKDQRFL